jgi:hypothetical protein
MQKNFEFEEAVVTEEDENLDLEIGNQKKRYNSQLAHNLPIETV